MITTFILLLLHLTLRFIISEICLPLALKVLPKLPLTLTFLFGDPLVLSLILALDHEDFRLASAQFRLRNYKWVVEYLLPCWATTKCWLLDFWAECQALATCSIDLKPLRTRFIVNTEYEEKPHHNNHKERTTTTTASRNLPDHIPEFDFPSTHSLQSFYSIRSYSTIVASDRLTTSNSPSTGLFLTLQAPSISTSISSFRSTLSGTTFSPFDRNNLTMTPEFGCSKVDREKIKPSTSQSSLSKSLSKAKETNTKKNRARGKTKLRSPKKITVKSTSKPKITISRERYRKVVKPGTSANTGKDNTRYRNLVEKLRKFRIDSD